MQNAVLDACILYQAPLRDFFMRLAVELYQPKWTDTIHVEWIRNVLKNRPDLSLTQLTRTRELMNRHGGACMVRSYKKMIPKLTLPDQKDRHVLAAAITAHASIIVTFNISDFPAKDLAPFKISAAHPDDFALNLYLSDREQFVRLVKVHRQALVNPTRTADEYLGTLSQCGLLKTVAALKNYVGEI